MTSGMTKHGTVDPSKMPKNVVKAARIVAIRQSQLYGVGEYTDKHDAQTTVAILCMESFMRGFLFALRSMEKGMDSEIKLAEKCSRYSCRCKKDKQMKLSFPVH